MEVHRGRLARVKSTTHVSTQFLLNGVSDFEVSEELAGHLAPRSSVQTAKAEEVRTQGANWHAKNASVFRQYVPSQATTGVSDIECGEEAAFPMRSSVQEAKAARRASNEARPSRISAQDQAKIAACREQVKLASWCDQGLVDCGCCALAFKLCPEGAALSTRAVLVIKIRRRARGVRHRRLWAALRSAVSIGVDFILTYDLRCPQPGITFMNDLIGFQQEQTAQLTKHLKCAVFLVRESIMVAASQQLLGGLVKACPSECPSAIVHSSKAADAFFTLMLGSNAASHGRRSGDYFVSVADVREAVRKNGGGPSRCCAVLSPVPRQSTTQRGDAAASECCAADCVSPTAQALQTLRALTAKADSFVHDSSEPKPVSFYTLPNGDVRVMQSLPAAVIVGQSVDTVSDACTREETTPEPANCKEAKICCDPTNDAMRPFALEFDCSMDVLGQLIGAYFHVGELIVDAEVQSMKQLQVTVPGKDGGESCLAAFASILCSRARGHLPTLLPRR